MGPRGGSDVVEFKPSECQPVRFSGQLSASEDVSSCENRSISLCISLLCPGLRCAVSPDVPGSIVSSNTVPNWSPYYIS